MQTWVIQNQGFNGGVKLRSQRTHRFYEYSLWHAPTGEHLFDGAAGDLAEAVDSLLAHINFQIDAEWRFARDGVTRPLKETGDQYPRDHSAVIPLEPALYGVPQ